MWGEGNSLTEVVLAKACGSADLQKKRSSPFRKVVCVPMGVPQRKTRGVNSLLFRRKGVGILHKQKNTPTKEGRNHGIPDEGDIRKAEKKRVVHRTEGLGFKKRGDKG